MVESRSHAFIQVLNKFHVSHSHIYDNYIVVENTCWECNCARLPVGMKGLTPFSMPVLLIPLKYNFNAT